MHCLCRAPYQSVTSLALTYTSSFTNCSISCAGVHQASVRMNDTQHWGANEAHTYTVYPRSIEPG